MPAPNDAAVIATDNCGGAVVITHSDQVIPGSCANKFVVQRTYTATDACGNSSSQTQTITVNDNTAPVITGIPADVTVQCASAVPAPNDAAVVAADNCSGAVVITHSDQTIPGSCANKFVLKRTYTATDGCGNSSSQTQTITVNDNTAPVITGIPADVTVQCASAVPAPNDAGVVAADNCSGTLVITHSDQTTPGSCVNKFVIKRTYTATDVCGNSSSRTQTITVNDNTAPVITGIPADVTVQCASAVPAPNDAAVVAADNCGGAVVITHSDQTIPGACANKFVVQRTYTATDACGNSSSQTQTITVNDNTAPVIASFPTNLTVQCASAVPAPNDAAVVATDNCSGAVVITHSDQTIPGSCANKFVIKRTYTATDVCGNSSSQTQTITVNDNTAPVITGIPADVTVQCAGAVPAPNDAAVVATDNCSGTVVITHSDQTIPGSCVNKFVIKRTYTATDVCGNSSSQIQSITVNDNVPPTMTVPPDLTLECPADLRTNVTGTATGQDGCGSVSITYSDLVTNFCGGSKVISRTWTVADACGNATNALQTITVRDTTPPALRLPANIVLQCPGDTRTNVTGAATAPDGCSSVTITYSDVVSNGCANTKTLWRTWVAVDACNNSTNGVQIITVQDTNKPSITCPNISIQCTDDVPAAYTNLAAFLAAGGTASDTCSSALTFSLISDSGLVGRCPGRVTRVYRVTDTCGNFADGTQTITVGDTIPPVLTCPTNRTVECALSLNPTNTGRATATDNCATNVSITYSDALVQSVYNYNVNFYAADSDLNTGPYGPTYLKVAPGSLPCPSGARLTGRAADPLRNAVAFGPTASTLDALTSLGGAPMAFGQIVPFEVVIGVSGNQGAGHGTVEFTVDWSTYTTSNDRFGFDTNYMVYCAFVDTADPGTLNPNHYAKVESFSSRLVNAGTISEAIEGTFRVSGLDVGDQVVVEIWLVMMTTQPAHVSGTIAAQLMSAQSLDPNPQPVSTGSKTISIGNLNKMTPLPPPQEQPGPTPPPPPLPVPGVTVAVWNRTWTAADDCNNQSTCVQRITVRDTAPPVIVAPNVVLEYPADTGTNVTGAAVAQDACGSVTALTYSDVVSNGCGNAKVIFRTWTATDDAGNSTNVVQTITVRDTISLACPADVVLECPATNTGTNVTGVATAHSSSGAVTLSYSDTVTNLCGATRVISRLWTATDACGNSTNAVQTITVQDTTPPTILCPTSLVLECPADTTTNATGLATATDAGGLVTIQYSDVASNGTGGTRIIARTWTAIDPCGNRTTAVQTITVRDTAPPKIAVALVDTLGNEGYAGGGAALRPGEPNFTTVFSKGLAVGHAGTNEAMAGNARLLWEPNTAGWTALTTVLAKGGETSGPLTQDAVNPTETLGGGDLAVQAATLTLNIGFNHAGMIGAGPNNFGSLVYNNASDSLSGQTVSQILEAANGALAGGSLPAGYDFSSLSALIGNLNLSFRNYTVSPWAAAHLSEPMLVVQCASQVPAPDPKQVSASDSCSSPVTVTHLSDATTEYVNPNNYVVVRTWGAADACGNTNSTSFRIVVRDTTPPVLTSAPDRTVTAGTSWDFDPPTAADNCSSATVSVLKHGDQCDRPGGRPGRSPRHPDLAGDGYRGEQRHRSANGYGSDSRAAGPARDWSQPAMPDRRVRQ